MNQYLDSSVMVAWLFARTRCDCPSRNPSTAHSPARSLSWKYRERCAVILWRERLDSRGFGSSSGRRDRVGSAKSESFRCPARSYGALPGPFRAVVGALDAIHLSTALMWREDTGDDVTFLTHDRQLRAAATSLPIRYFAALNVVQECESRLRRTSFSHANSG